MKRYDICISNGVTAALHYAMEAILVQVIMRVLHSPGHWSSFVSRINNGSSRYWQPRFYSIAVQSLTFQATKGLSIYWKPHVAPFTNMVNFNLRMDK